MLVLIPGGTFRMGSAEDPDSSPPREVRVAPFLLSKYETTQRQWARATSRLPSEFKAGNTIAGTKIKITASNPVERISREGAEHTARRLNLRLPSEAEWEYAARAGSLTPWWTGAEARSLAGAGNVADLTFQRAGGAVWEEFEDGYLVHAPVGSYRANAFGLHDTIGNVYEWVQDVYQFSYRSANPTQAPWLSYPDGQSPNFVYRGGSFASLAGQTRSAYRLHQTLSFRSKEIGVRYASSLRSADR